MQRRHANTENPVQSKQPDSSGSKASVQSVTGEMDMRMRDENMRGHMIMLKKIMMSYVQTKIKKLITATLKHGVWLVFHGIDATNLHFSNKFIHTHFIHVALIPNTQSGQSNQTPDFQNAKKIVLNTLIAEMNEVMVGLCNMDKCTDIKTIANHCGRSTINSEKFFTPKSSAESNHAAIEFNYHSGGDKTQPVVLIEALPECTASPLDNYGVKFLPLGFVYNSIMFGPQTETIKYIRKNFTTALIRQELTFSYPIVEALIRECFPGVSVMKSGSSSVAGARVTQLIVAAPESAKLNELHAQMKKELGESAREDINKSVSFPVMFERSVALGFLPDDASFQSATNNDYNKTIIVELKTELVGVL